MLDIKQIRKEPDTVKELLNRRNPDFAASVDEIIAIDVEARKLLQERQELEASRNQLSKQVGQKKSQGQDASVEMTALAEIKAKLQEFSEREPLLVEKQKHILDRLPNLPDSAIPEGIDETYNQEILRWGEARKFDFPVLEHDEIGKILGIFDFERGVKIAKSRFTLLMGIGAKLERALINFMLDKAAANGYQEVFPPIMANSASFYAVGQLPKFKEDLFKIENEDLYMVPTAEVPLTNIYRDEILDIKQLPIKLCAFTPNFRAEAGAASKDTRGIIRQHQFNKIELVKLCSPENSQEEHEQLTKDAESILQALELPYRKVLLCAGDMGASASRCYDLEVWFPGQNKYREISSCSNFIDFQARRAQIRFKRNAEAKTELVHTINGSGLAVGRCLAAILENYQNSDNSVTVPIALRPYLAGLERIQANGN